MLLKKILLDPDSKVDQDRTNLQKHVQTMKPDSSLLQDLFGQIWEHN